MRLLHFMADLTRDAELQREFVKDPTTVMDQRDLTASEQELVHQRDAAAIGEAIARELREFSAGGRFRWPSASSELTSAEPTRAPAGSSVRVIVEGQYFPKITRCALVFAGAEPIEGVIESLVRGARSSLEVTFAIPRDAPQGSWEVVVSDDGGRSEKAPVLFDVLPPPA